MMGRRLGSDRSDQLEVAVGALMVPQVRYAIWWNALPSLTVAVHGKTPRGDLLQLKEDWRFYIVYEFQAYEVTGPRGFLSDGPSIPVLLQWLVSVEPANRVPALAHDIGYCVRGFGERIPREAWDHYFSLGMISLGHASWKTGLMHQAVRFGGRKAWGDQSAVDRYNMESGSLPRIRAVSLRVLGISRAGVEKR